MARKNRKTKKIKKYYRGGSLRRAQDGGGGNIANVAANLIKDIEGANVQAGVGYDESAEDPIEKLRRLYGNNHPVVLEYEKKIGNLESGYNVSDSLYNVLQGEKLISKLDREQQWTDDDNRWLELQIACERGDQEACEWLKNASGQEMDATPSIDTWIDIPVDESVDPSVPPFLDPSTPQGGPFGPGLKKGGHVAKGKFLKTGGQTRGGLLSRGKKGSRKLL